MISQRRLLYLTTFLIIVSLFLVACERPLGGGDTPADQTTQNDADAGGGTDGSGEAVVEVNDPAEETAVTEGGAEQTDAAADTDEEMAEEGGEAAETSNEEEAEEATEVTTTDGEASAEETTDEETTTEGDGDADDSDGEEATDSDDDADSDDDSEGDDTNGDGTIPETHTVAEGENLYRIGLQYGISWKAIAIENHLSNPNIVKVGQVLKLPGATPVEEPTPTPSPQTETTYVVKPGDTLFLIGKHFGISWIQIAEANGLVNPNLIQVGDELKIPVSTPGPAPEFTHVVKHGDTLFRISLQYGVAMPAIAEENDLASPFIIYVGQTLEIPGGEEVDE